MKKVFQILTFLLLIPSVQSQNSKIEEETKTFREFVQEERKQHREMVESFAKTAQEDRKNHQEFIENTFKWTSWLVGLVAAVFVFLGIKSFTDIQKVTSELKQKAQEAQTKADAEISKLKGELGQVASQYADQKREIGRRLADSERDYQRLIEQVNQKLQAHRGRYLMICTAESKMVDMQINLVGEFSKSLSDLKTSATIEADLSQFDVIIYRSNVDANGEDENLKLLVEKVKAQSLPLVVFAANQSEFLKGETDKIAAKYLLQSRANYLTTLIDNAASSYRVKKLRESQA